MRALFQIGVFLLAMASAVEVHALPAWGQEGPPPPPPPRREGFREGARRRLDEFARRRQERRQFLQFMILDRLSKMDPAEREKLLSKLPPQRRRWAEESLQRFEKMPPERRRALEQRFQQFSQMTPERQQHLRELMRTLGQLPMERRQSIQAEFRKIKHMPVEDRLDYTSSSNFNEKFDEADRELLLDLVDTAPDP